MVPIGQPSLAEQQVLEAMEIWDSRSHHGRQPHWLMWFAFNRDELSSSILRYDYNDGTSRFYRFVLATQNPLLVVVEVARLAVDCLSDIEWLDLPAEAHAWDHHLVRSVGQMLYSANGAIDDTRANVFLLMHSSCRNGFHVCGDGEFVPIEPLLDSLPWPERDHEAHDNGGPGAPSCHLGFRRNFFGMLPIGIRFSQGIGRAIASMTMMSPTRRATRTTPCRSSTRSNFWTSLLR